MKKLFPILFLLLIQLSAFGQTADYKQEDKISWYFSVKPINDTEADLIMKAVLADHWHVFSLTHDIEKADYTGTTTKFTFAPNSSYKLIGSPREPKPKSVTSSIGVEVYHDKHEVIFKQRIKILSKSKFTIDMKFDFQVCFENCLMPQTDIPFTFSIDPSNLANSKAIKVIDENNDKNPNDENVDENIVELAPGECPDPEEDTSHVTWAYKSYLLEDGNYEMVLTAKIDSGWHLINKDSKGFLQGLNFSFNNNPDLYELIGEIEKTKLLTGDDSVLNRSVEYFTNKVEFRQKIKLKTDSIPVIGGIINFSSISEKYISVPLEADIHVDLTKARKNESSSKIPSSLWAIFIMGFLGGLAALLTPCVFPMIPMTVSFFTKQSKTKAMGIRNAIIYGISIIVIYVALGLGVTMIFGAGALNALSTNVWFNIAFFLLLVVFGASFLGAFEIKLPSSWINNADKNADKGGLIGIFFMAFTLGLVSFSCTGPIIGTLLVESVDNGIMGPFWGMFGFSLALALPFALFSAFPGWLNSMPQSGGWLNSVKVVLGLLEIALAFKFLSNADLVVQAEMLTREIYLSFWIVIFAIMGFYLMGKVKLPHDSDVPHVSVPRLSMAIVVFSFVVYMIPGMWGAPLSMLSGILPPQTVQYSEYPYGIGGEAPTYFMPEGTHPGPNGIPVFHEYNEALAYARKEKKPLLLDFTGWACANCRRMEDNVWKKDEITKILTEKYVVVSLYVDEDQLLPTPETAEDGTILTTVGQKWMHMEETRYGQTSQPLYVVVDHEEEMIGPWTTYDTEADLDKRFKKWLEDNETEYKERINEFTVNSKSYRLVKSCYPQEIPNYQEIEKLIFGEE
jgi:thiol:disulfide interchange protein DsbD